MIKAWHSSECWAFSLSIANPFVWITPTPSQHNGQQLPPGLPPYQLAPDYLPIAQDERL